MKKYRSMATILGICLNVLSGIFTVKLMWAFATSGIGKIIFAGFGILMQTSMAVCAVFAVHCIFQKQTARAIPAIVVYFGLLLLSFCGTAGNLSTENANLNNAGVTDSLEFKTISGQIADIDKQAEYLRKEIDECRARNVITRCVKPKSEELSGLMTEKRALQDRLLAVKPEIAEDEIFRRISVFLDQDVDQTKSIVFLLYSLLLDICGACFLIYGSGLLAFKTRDIWNDAEMKTEAEKMIQQQEREKLLSAVSARPQTEKRIIQDRPEPEDPKPIRQVPGFTPALAKKHPVGYLSDVQNEGSERFRKVQGFVNSEPIARVQKGSEPVFRMGSEKVPEGFRTPSTVEPFRTPSTVESFEHSEWVQKGSESVQKSDVQKGSEKVQKSEVQKVQNVQIPAVQKVQTPKVQNLSEPSGTDIARYVRSAFSGRDKRGFLLGRNRIGQELGLSVDDCNRIHLMLKKAGLIEVRSQKTYPLKSEEEILSAVRRHKPDPQRSLL